MLSLLLTASIAFASEPRSLFGYDLELHAVPAVIDGKEYVALPVGEAEVLLDLFESRGPALVATATTGHALQRSLEAQIEMKDRVIAEQGKIEVDLRLKVTEEHAQSLAWESAAREMQKGGGLFDSPVFWGVVGAAVGAGAVALGVWAGHGF